MADLQAEVDRLTSLLDGVVRTQVDGHDTIRFSDMNVQVVNGTGSTDGDPNGLGNLIIGYNHDATNNDERTGSHYLVVGDEHTWTSFGGVIAGDDHTATGQWASVSGGRRNTASGDWSSVTGGLDNTASGPRSSVSGGRQGTAIGNYSSVSGGFDSTASGHLASVLGGRANTASSDYSAVSGGQNNTAGGTYSSVVGGYDATLNSDAEHDTWVGGTQVGDVGLFLSD